MLFFLRGRIDSACVSHFGVSVDSFPAVVRPYLRQLRCAELSLVTLYAGDKRGYAHAYPKNPMLFGLSRYCRTSPLPYTLAGNTRAAASSSTNG